MSVTAREIKREAVDVWPKVRRSLCKTKNVAHFSETLRLYTNADGSFSSVQTGNNTHQAWDEQTPIDGIELTITAEGGEELPRIHQGDAVRYLVLEDCKFVCIESETLWPKVGEVYNNKADCNGKPLPRGTVTKIVVKEGEIAEVRVEKPPKPKFPHVLKSGNQIIQSSGEFIFVNSIGEMRASVPADDMREALAYIDSVEGA